MSSQRKSQNTELLVLGLVLAGIRAFITINMVLVIIATVFVGWADGRDSIDWDVDDYQGWEIEEMIEELR